MSKHVVSIMREGDKWRGRVTLDGVLIASVTRYQRDYAVRYCHGVVDRLGEWILFDPSCECCQFGEEHGHER